MKIIGIIPARYDSTRFPGKMLALIKGKPLIQRVWGQANKVRNIDEVIIATDDSRIFSCAKKFGAQVAMASKKCRSGTDRIAQVARKIKCDVVVNIQGDEPLIQPEVIEKTVSVMKTNSNTVMSTPVSIITDKNNLTNPNIVKVVLDKNNFAMYFSRSLIPFSREFDMLSNSIIFYKHIGIYVYRKKFLLKFVNLPESKLEKIERLEQLRVLENDYRIKVAIVKDDSIPVDLPEDIKKVEKRV